MLGPVAHLVDVDVLIFYNGFFYIIIPENSAPFLLGLDSRQQDRKLHVLKEEDRRRHRWQLVEYQLRFRQSAKSPWLKKL